MSALLLISFAAIVFPLDVFHNHTASPRSTVRDLNTSSKSMVSTDGAGYCWVCSVHFDKSFTKPDLIDKIQVSVPVSVFEESDFLGYFVEQLLSTLRGPPSR